jgi:tRNA pseudouridine55 synthase
MLSGLLLVDKPAGVTSHDVVQLIRRKLGVRRIGHTGTLDPIAEGLLLLLVGPATRFQRAFQAHEKTYEAVIRLGTQTDTADAAGATLRIAPIPVLERGQVAAILASFHGPLSQTPPAYSAVKVKGRPAYWWARRKQSVTLAPRVVHLADMELVALTPETVTFRVRCSAGTYVRTLAETIAERLGTAGHLAHLVRLRIGDWSLDDAKPLSWFRDASPQMVAGQLKPCESLQALTP